MFLILLPICFSTCNYYYSYINLHSTRITVLVIIKLTKFPVPVRLCCCSGKLDLVIILFCFAIFKSVVHSLKPGETPRYSAFRKAPNYVQRSEISQNTCTLKRCVAVAVRLRLFFQLTKNQHCTRYVLYSTGHY